MKESAKMKILLAQTANYLYSWGGGFKGNRILLEGLTKMGHDCHILTPPFPLGYDEYLGKLAERGITPACSSSGLVFEHNGVTAHIAPDSVQMCGQLMRLMRELEPDRTVVSEDSSYMILAAALETDPARTVYITRTAGNLPFGPDCLVEDPTKAEIMRKAAGILTVSKYMQNYLKEWGGLESTSIYWPAYGSPPFPLYGDFTRGYVTLVNPCNIKGLPIFLGLVRKFPEVEFAAVPTWGTEDEGRSVLTGLPNVTILQPQEDINKIFAQTRVLLVPSLCADALPQIVVQGMVRGIPVLGSSLGGIPEAKLGVDYVLPVRQVCYERHGLANYSEVVPEQDVGPWEEALRDLLSSRERYERVASDSREAALRFVAKLGFEPFEQYLENLKPAAGTRAGAAEPAQSDELQERLSQMSPERRALLALRLSKKKMTASDN
jgi:glycosyltransferase involved in cell wall biosynthesis